MYRYEDNFFEFGGDSLLAAQAASQIEKSFGVKLTLDEFLNASTVSELTLVLLQRLAKTANAIDLSHFLDEIEDTPIGLKEHRTQ
jgi:hypothetical protein